MLKMMEAFSNANEYWEVGLCVNASNLNVDDQHLRQDGVIRMIYIYQVNDILMWFSSTGNRKSNNSS